MRTFFIFLLGVLVGCLLYSQAEKALKRIDRRIQQKVEILGTSDQGYRQVFDEK